jgi:hypothetical protein
MIINPYFFAPNLLLDNYPTTGAAYSVRKLKKTYSGAAIRVRRSSDNTESDIGFVGNDLDTATLLTFCGVGNGFVTKWYDQSGNAFDGTQTTAANQPRIVNSGNLELNANGKVGVRFIDGSGAVLQNLNIPLWHANNDAWVGTFSTYQLNLSGFFPHLQGSNPADKAFLLIHNDTFRALRLATVRVGGVSLANSITTLNLNQLYLRYDLANRTNIQSYLDGSVTASINSTDNNSNFDMPTNYVLGNTNFGSITSDIILSEFIAYKVNQSSNAALIQSNIKTYFLIP